MANVSIPQKEYQQLIDKALRFEYLRQIIREDVFSPPPTRDVKEILQSFKVTKIYTSKFLKNLEQGLRRSLYFKS